MRGHSNIKVTLLSKEDIEGKSKVLKQIGIKCGKEYWTSTPSCFFNRGFVQEFYVTSAGEFHEGITGYPYGVRPVLKINNLELLIKKSKGWMNDNIQIIEYGQFPHLFERVEIYNEANLQRTGRGYIVPTQDSYPLFFSKFTYPEYDYYGQKVIVEANGEYHPVKPVKFAVDRENSMLISLEVLFNSTINIHNQKYNGAFETSDLYKYLNNEFIQCLVVDVDTTDKEISESNTSEDEYSMQTIISENNELRSDVQRKKELLERLKELIKENEALRLQSTALDNEIEKIMSGMESNGPVKKLHL